MGTGERRASGISPKSFKTLDANLPLQFSKLYIDGGAFTQGADALTNKTGKCKAGSLTPEARFSVSEVADPGKHHRQTQPVRGLDYFRIALRAAGLDHGSGTGLGDFFDPIRKGKECIGRDHSALERELSLHGRVGVRVARRRRPGLERSPSSGDAPGDPGISRTALTSVPDINRRSGGFLA